MLLNKEILTGVFGSCNKRIQLNISWNTGTRVVTAYEPGQPIGENDFDRPRINTWRSDENYTVYLSAGNQVYNPQTSTFSTPWGDRSIGSETLNLSLHGSLSGGVDLFTSSLFPPPTLVPDISEWTVTTTNPDELRYQYTLTRASSAIQNISITLN